MIDLSTEPADIATLAAALRHSARQIRVGAARGLAGANPDLAVPILAEALDDPHSTYAKR
ncbi:hypothetical protein [Nocardia sp. NBC_01730]|uniref:hypothetical protein n=1 Tax=Nocardia sp. NBC_01730 TaxID=2975998 RepID=UPI003FA3C4B5